jgi:ankyrin repeat protein
MDDLYLTNFYDELAGMAAGFEDAPEIGPHTRSRVGDTPLHIAAIRGDVKAIGLLLDLGADINARGENGYTALHYAVAQERPDVVRLLLGRGADKDIRFFDGRGQTADELAHCSFIINNEIIILLQNRAA